MKKNLVIVESPAKAKTIEKILGKDFKVEASVGHIRDLPAHYLGVDIKNDFTPKYVETDRGKGIIQSLKKSAKTAETVFLAPDPDREGEAIAWHLKEALKDSVKSDFQRVSFNSITKSAVLQAFENPRELDLNLVNSQQARRIIDRIVGFQVSPLVRSAVQNGTSAGRVQTVALRLVCERERAILAFKPQEYWNFVVDLDAEKPNSGKTFSAKLAKINNKKLDIDNEKTASSALQALKTATQWEVSDFKVTPKKKYPYPPFITSTLQQSASSVLSFNSNFTMTIAQQLYEGIQLGDKGHLGLITYMRTDSFNIAPEALNDCRSFINSDLGKDFLPPKPNYYKSKSSAQAAHEAIRPTDVSLTPNSIKQYLDNTQFKLYSIIWKRFVASQMTPAQQKQTTIEVLANGSDENKYLFKTVKTITTFPGYLKMYKSEDEKEDDIPLTLAELKVGTPCFLLNLNSEQKFTEPPSRYSEASLIKELEANGVGRPSTYASIINTIQQRAYVDRKKGSLHPSPLGLNVNDFLIESFPALFEVDFTATMEMQLDKIEEDNISWTEMLHNFYDKFHKWLNDVKFKDAPETSKTEAVLQLLDIITEWAPKEKIGKYTVDDEKFFESIKEKYEKDSIISLKQWNVLLKIAGKYENSLPNLKENAKENGYLEDLNKVYEKEKEAEKKRQDSALGSQDAANFAELFEACKNIEWNEPNKVGRRVFDDNKFFTSIQSYVGNGKKLSDRQFVALYKTLNKYTDQIDNYKQLFTTIGFDTEQKKAENPVVQKDIDFLSNVKKWDAPTKKGRRTYDDKHFYDSIKQQYQGGGILSSKQIVAFAKIADKYRKVANGETSINEVSKVNTNENNNDEKVKNHLDMLAKVKEWDMPSTKGKRTFSDEAFYKSLNQQANSGKILSVKQVAALEKLATKYNK